LSIEYRKNTRVIVILQGHVHQTFQDQKGSANGAYNGQKT